MTQSGGTDNSIGRRSCILDPVESWQVVRRRAEESLARGTRHESPDHNRDYRVLSVTAAKITVERIGRDGKPQEQPLTRSAVQKMIQVLNEHPDGCPRSTLHGTYYFTNMLIELHPRIELRGDGIVIALRDPADDGRGPAASPSPVAEVLTVSSLGDQPTRASAQDATPRQPVSPVSAGALPTAAGRGPEPGHGRHSRSAPASSLPKEMTDRYDILESLGEGGMGQVWKARDRSLGRFVALKQIRGSLAEDRHALDRFLTEAKAVAALNHRNVIGIYELNPSVPFMAMEYADGGDLATLVSSRKTLPVKTAVEITTRVASALQAAHTHPEKILHRDIKPANILLMSERGGVVPKLCDFGLARLESVDGLTVTGNVLGTLDYMAPEQRRDVSLTSAQSDQWSLAATLYVMVSGREPRTIRERDIPEALRDVVLRALEDDPSERFDDLDAFAAALRKCLKGVPQSASNRSTVSQSTPSKSPPLLVSPFSADVARQTQEAWSDYLGRPVAWENSIGMQFRLIPPGEFLMGAPKEEADSDDDERPQHVVRITKPFYCGVYPVTQSEFAAVTGQTPSQFTKVKTWLSLLRPLQIFETGTDRFPVKEVSWGDAQEFLTQLMSRGDESGRRYRLLSEAEWEYSCRAGTTTPFWFGNALNGEQANCDGNYPYGTTAEGPYLARPSVVGSYGANPFGLDDTHGNVWEWCSDRFGENYYASSPTDDPSGAPSGSSRVLRGGSWRNDASSCRCAGRRHLDPANRNNNIGFRVLCEL